MKNSNKFEVVDFRSSSTEKGKFLASPRGKKTYWSISAATSLIGGLFSGSLIGKIFNPEFIKNMINSQQPQNIFTFDLLNPTNIVKYPFPIAMVSSALGFISYRAWISIKTNNPSINNNEHGGAQWTEPKKLLKQYKAVPDRDFNYPGLGGWPITHYFLDNKEGRELSKRMGIIEGDFRPISKMRSHGLGGFNNKTRKATPGVFLVDSDTSNMLGIGMTRSGKGEGDVVATVDVISRAEIKSSMMINDPKGELYQMGYETLRKRGYNVQVLNLQQMDASMSYNPLQVIVDFARAGYISETQRAIDTVVTAIFQEAKEKGSDPFWPSSGANMVASVILALVDEAFRKEYRAKQLIKTMDREQTRAEANVAWGKVNLHEVHRFISTLGGEEIGAGPNIESKMSSYFSKLSKIPNVFPGEDFRNLAVGAYAQTKISGKQTAGSIVSTALDTLKLYQQQQVAKLTSKNTLDLTSLGFPRRLNVRFDDEKIFYSKLLVTFIDTNTNKIIESSNTNVDSIGNFSLPIKSIFPDQINVTINLLDNWGKKIFKRDEHGNSLESKISFSMKKKYKKTLNGVENDRFTQRPIILGFELVEDLNEIDKFEIGGISALSLIYSEKPIALFLVTPPSDPSFNQLGSFLVTQMFNANAQAAASAPGRKLVNRIYFILDEFANLPVIPSMDTKVSIGAGYGLLFKFIVQDLEQLEKVYGEATAEIIISNSSNIMYVLSNSDKTNERISKLLGNKTIAVQNASHTKGTGFNNENISTQLMAQPLLSPVQLGNLIEGETVVLRYTHRKSLDNQNIRPDPIFNTGNNRIPMRYQLDKNKAFDQNNTMASIPVENPYQRLKITEIEEDFNRQFDLLNQDLRNDFEINKNKVSEIDLISKEDRGRIKEKTKRFNTETLTKKSLLDSKVINSSQFNNILVGMNKRGLFRNNELFQSFFDNADGKIALNKQGADYFNNTSDLNTLKQDIGDLPLQSLVNSLDEIGIQINNKY